MPVERPIRIVIVDDHDLLREGVVSLLAPSADIEVLAGAASAEEALQLCEELEPDVVLMDLKLPGMDGISAIRTLALRQPAIRILAVTNYEEEDTVTAAIQAGAIGYLLKNVSGDKLVDAIRNAHVGTPTLSPEATQALMHAASRPTQSTYNLTRREFEVLGLMTHGLSNIEIASRLVVSRYTIKTHVSNILSKMGVSSRTEAVARALEEDLIH